MTSPALTVDDTELWHDFQAAVACDTSARAGEHAVSPHDTRIARFMSEVGVPLLTGCGASTRLDSMNNLIATFGPLTGQELLLVAYPVNHHGNQMTDPLHARRRRIGGEEHWVGQGASQGKGGLAALIAAVQAAARAGAPLAGRVAVALCSEGSSTHASSTVLYDQLEPKPRGAVLTIGTGNQLSLGNRGRVDVIIDIHGSATHSSAQEAGHNPIPLVAAVLGRLAGCVPAGEAHPLLGPRAQVPYRLACGPIAPHTIPESCQLVLDRRTLPGDHPDQLLAAVRDALAGLPATVTAGPCMMPALVNPFCEVVQQVQRAAISVTGHLLPVIYPAYTFDAGYPCSLGIPAVMLGPSSPALATREVLGEDHVAAADIRQAATLYASLITTPGEGT